MNLDKTYVPKMKNNSLNLQKFNMDFVTASRPVVIEGMAAEWDALENWKDMDQVGSLMGESFTSMSRIGRMKDDKDYSMYRMKSQKMPSKYKAAFQ